MARTKQVARMTRGGRPPYPKLPSYVTPLTPKAPLSADPPSHPPDDGHSSPILCVLASDSHCYRFDARDISKTYKSVSLLGNEPQGAGAGLWNTCLTPVSLAGESYPTRIAIAQGFQSPIFPDGLSHWPLSLRPEQFSATTDVRAPDVHLHGSLMSPFGDASFSRLFSHYRTLGDPWVCPLARTLGVCSLPSVSPFVSEKICTTKTVLKGMTWPKYTGSVESQLCIWDLDLMNEPSNCGARGQNFPLRGPNKGSLVIQSVVRYPRSRSSVLVTQSSSVFEYDLNSASGLPVTSGLSSGFWSPLAVAEDCGLVFSMGMGRRILNALSMSDLKRVFRIDPQRKEYVSSCLFATGFSLFVGYRCRKYNLGFVEQRDIRKLSQGPVQVFAPSPRSPGATALCASNSRIFGTSGSEVFCWDIRDPTSETAKCVSFNGQFSDHANLCIVGCPDIASESTSHDGEDPISLLKELKVFDLTLSAQDDSELQVPKWVVGGAGDRRPTNVPTLPSTEAFLRTILLGEGVVMDQSHIFYETFVEMGMLGFAGALCYAMKRMKPEAAARLLVNSLQLHSGDDGLTDFQLSCLNILRLDVILEESETSKRSDDSLYQISRQNRLVFQYLIRRQVSIERTQVSDVEVGSFMKCRDSLFRQRYEDQQDTNVTLVTDDGTEVKAHLGVLLTRSRFFRRMMAFAGKERQDFQESHRISIEENCLSGLDLVEFVRFVYTKSLSESVSAHQVLRLFSFSVKFFEMDLQRHLRPVIVDLFTRKLKVGEVLALITELHLSPVLDDIEGEWLNGLAAMRLSQKQLTSPNWIAILTDFSSRVRKIGEGE